MSSTFSQDVVTRYNVLGMSVSVDLTGTMVLLGTPEGLMGIHLDSPGIIVKFYNDKTKWNRRVVRWCPKVASKTFFASAAGKTCKIFDVRKDAPLSILRGHSKPISDVAWAPITSNATSDVLVTAGLDGQLLLWDLRSPRRPSQCVATTSPFPSKISWHPHRNFLLATANGSDVHVWDRRFNSSENLVERSHVRSNSKCRCVSSFRAERQSTVEGLMWLSHKTEMSLLTFGKKSKSVSLFSNTGKLHRTFAVGSHPLQNVLPCPFGDKFCLLTTSQRGDFSIRLWRHTTLLRDISGTSVEGFMASATETMAAGSFVSSHSYSGHEAAITDIAWRSRGNRHQIVSWSKKDQHLRLWRVSKSHLQPKARTSSAGGDERDDDLIPDDEDIKEETRVYDSNDEEPTSTPSFIVHDARPPMIDAHNISAGVDLIPALKKGAFMDEDANEDANEDDESSLSSGDDDDNESNDQARKTGSSVPHLNGMGSLRDFWTAKNSDGVRGNRGTILGSLGGSVSESSARRAAEPKAATKKNVMKIDDTAKMVADAAMSSRRPMPPTGTVAVFGALNTLILFNIRPRGRSLDKADARSAEMSRCALRHRRFRSFEEWCAHRATNSVNDSAASSQSKSRVTQLRTTTTDVSTSSDDEDGFLKLMMDDNAIEASSALLRRLPISHPSHVLGSAAFANDSENGEERASQSLESNDDDLSSPDNADDGPWWTGVFGSENRLPISDPNHSFALEDANDAGTNSDSELEADGRNESENENRSDESEDTFDNYSDNDDLDLRDNGKVRDNEMGGHSTRPTQSDDRDERIVHPDNNDAYARSSRVMICRTRGIARELPHSVVTESYWLAPASSIGPSGSSFASKTRRRLRRPASYYEVCLTNALIARESGLGSLASKSWRLLAASMFPSKTHLGVSTSATVATICFALIRKRMLVTAACVACVALESTPDIRCSHDAKRCFAPLCSQFADIFYTTGALRLHARMRTCASSVLDLGSSEKSPSKNVATDDDGQHRSNGGRGLRRVFSRDALNKMVFGRVSTISQSSAARETSGIENVSVRTVGKTVRCSFCHLPVRGMVASCSRCGCGGHIDCLKRWFGSGQTQCPAGCTCHCVLAPVDAERSESEETQRKEDATETDAWSVTSSVEDVEDEEDEEMIDDLSDHSYFEAWGEGRVDSEW